MKIHSIGIVAALTLGSIAGAHAQDGTPGKKEAPAAQSQDRVPSVERSGGEGASPSVDKGARQAEQKVSPERGADKSSGEGPKQRQAREGKGNVEKQDRDARSEERRATKAAQSKDLDTPKKPEKQAVPKDRDASKKAASKDDTSKQDEPKDIDAAKKTESKGDGSKQVAPKEPEAAKKAESKDDGSKEATSKDLDTSDKAPSKDTEAAKKADSTDRADADKAKQVQLAGEKGDRVRNAFRDTRDVKHRTKVDINIAVGTRLPRTWDYNPVPISVVEFVPEYRDFVFVYVDDEYLICDPVTYEVVTIIDAPDSATYASGGGSGGKCSTSLALTNSDRDLILRSIQLTDEVDVTGVNIGWRVPQDIELRAFPESVLSRIGELGPCRYFIIEHQVAIVDPNNDKVVLLLEKE